MITPLTPEVMSRALRDIAGTEPGRAAGNRRWQQSFCEHLVEEVTSRKVGREPDRVAYVAAELVVECARIATPHAAADLACRIATEWLLETAWRLVLEPDGVHTLGDLLAEGPGRTTHTSQGAALPKQLNPPTKNDLTAVIQRWVGTHVVHRSSGRMVSGRIFDATFQTKLLFIGTRISNVSTTARTRLQQHSESLARTAFSVGAFRCHQTAILSDPALPTSHDPKWRCQDEDVIAASDLLVIVWDAPADGFGSLVEMATQYRIPWVIVKVGKGRISPMLRGRDLPAPVLSANTYLQEFAGLLREDHLKLRRRQRVRRASLYEARRELDDIREALETLPPTELAATAPQLLMSQYRFTRLINNPSLWRAATGEEQAEVRLVAGWHPPLLFDEARALAGVVEPLMLPRTDVRTIEHQGRREKALAATGSARFNAEAPQDWLRLISNMRRRGLLR